MKKDNKLTILTSLLFFMIGFILFNNPGGVVKFITYIFGGIFLFIGAIYLFQYWKSEEKQFLSSELYSGILSVFIGIIVMFCAGAIELAIRLITGAWILCRALFQLKASLYMKELKVPSWITGMIASFLLLVIGLYIILKSNLVLSSIGIILMIYAVIELVETVYEMIKKPKDNIIIK